VKCASVTNQTTQATNPYFTFCFYPLISDHDILSLFFVCPLTAQPKALKVQKDIM